MGASARDIKAGKAWVVVGADKSPLITGLKSIDRDLQRWGSRATRMGVGMVGAAAGIATPLLLMTQHFATAGSTLNDMSARTSASVEELSKLGYAARQTGTDTAALETATKKLGDNLAAAVAGNPAAAKMFAGLGLSAKTLIKLPLEQQFATIADRLNAIPNPALRTAAAIDLFGKSGTMLLPMLAGGSGELLRMINHFVKLGGVIDNTDAADALGDRLDDLKEVFDRTAYAVGETLAPAVMQLTEPLLNAAVATKEFIAANPGVVETTAMVAAGVGAAGAAFLSLGATTAVVGMGLKGLATTVGVAGSAFAAVTSPIGLTVTGVAALASGVLYAAGQFPHIANAASNAAETMKDSWGGVIDAIAGGDLALAGNIASAGLNVVWATGLAKLETNFHDTMDRIREKTLVTTITGEVGSVLTWDGTFIQSLNEEIAGSKIVRDKAAKDSIAVAENELAQLREIAEKKRAIAEQEKPKPKPKKTPSADPIEGNKTAKRAHNEAGTFSGIVANANRSGLSAGTVTPATEMDHVATETEQLNDRLSDNETRWNRWSDIAVTAIGKVMNAGNKPAAQIPPPPPVVQPGNDPAADPAPKPMTPRQQQIAAIRQQAEQRKAENESKVQAAAEARAANDKKRHFAAFDRWDKRFDEAGAAEQGWTKGEWIKAQKDKELGKRTTVDDEGREVAMPAKSEDLSAEFGPGQSVPRGEGLTLPAKGETEKRGRYLKDANAQLNDQLGGFGLGERLAALRKVREAKGYPASTPLSTIKQRHPEEVHAELQNNRDKNLLAGTMPNLELGQQAGKESHSRGDVTEFKPGKIVSTNRGPMQREGDAIDAKIADKQHEADLAKGSAEAFAGMAQEPLAQDQPPVLIKSPQQALPVSEEGRQAMAEARDWQPTDRTPTVPIVPDVLPASMPPLAPLTQTIEQQLAGDVQRQLDPPILETTPTESLLPLGEGGRRPDEGRADKDLPFPPVPQTEQPQIPVGVKETPEITAAQPAGVTVPVSTAETPTIAPPAVSPVTIPVNAQSVPEITAAQPAGVTVPVSMSPTPVVAAPDTPTTPRVPTNEDKSVTSPPPPPVVSAEPKPAAPFPPTSTPVEKTVSPATPPSVTLLQPTVSVNLNGDAFADLFRDIQLRIPDFSDVKLPTLSTLKIPPPPRDVTKPSNNEDDQTLPKLLTAISDLKDAIIAHTATTA